MRLGSHEECRNHESYSIYTPVLKTLGGVLRRVNLVKVEFQVDSIRDQGTDSGYESKKFQTVRLTPATLTFLFLKYFTSVENFLLR